MVRMSIGVSRLLAGIQPPDRSGIGLRVAA